MIKCIINDKVVKTSSNAGLTTLDLIRDELRLTGTKEGCKEGECGACTVLLGEVAENGEMNYITCASCLLPIGDINNKHIVTVEGVNGNELNPIQQAIFENDASQCGFCTPGIVLSLTGFMLSSKTLSYRDAEDALDGNICRCTGYVAIKNAAKSLTEAYTITKIKNESRVNQLIDWSILPEYFRSIPQQLKNLNNKESVGNLDDAGTVLVAGGTDLFVQIPDSLLDSDLRFISNYPDMKKIEIKENSILMGGGVTVADIRDSSIISEYFSNLRGDLLLISSKIMRNRATVAGNIVNASPIGDMSILLLALNAELILKKDQSERTVALKHFYKSYKKFDLKQNEIIQYIKLPIPNKNCQFNFEKVSTRRHLDIASCNSAISFELENDLLKNVRISAGGVFEIPLYLSKTSEYLNGKHVSLYNIKKAAEVLLQEIKPIDDIRGTAEYKILLIRQLFFGHFIKYFPEIISLKEVIK